MHLTTVLATATLALTANAFLIPLEIADDVEATKAANLIPSIVDHNTQTLNLDCSTCPFALATERHGVHEWTNDVKSDLEMKFAADNKHLTLNGKALYPVTINHLPGELFATQVEKESSTSKDYKGYNGDLKLSYTLEIPQPQKKEDVEMVTIVMSILALDGQMVKVDDVEIQALKEADGSLSLASVKAVPTSPNDPDAQCTNMMCRVMAKLGAAMAKARAKAASAAAATASTAEKVKCFCMRCFHRMAGHPAASKPESNTIQLPTHNRMPPTQFGSPHGPHGHHHGFFHSVLAFARRMFTFVLLPVMVGVAVGITASAMGMLVGQAVVFLWMKYRRSDSRQAAYSAVESDDKEEGLPAYDSEGLPAYVDVEDTKEVEEKA